jgi:diguanylate cyclase (GGDEF)-like protein
LNKRTAYPLLVPAALVVFSALLVWKWPGLMKHIGSVKELSALLLLLPSLPYAFFAAGMIIGWRFNNAGLILTFLALGLAYWSSSNVPYPIPARGYAHVSLVQASTVLLPLNLCFFATLMRRRLSTPIGLFSTALIVLQAVLLLLFCQTVDSPLYQMISEGNASWPFLYRFVARFSAKFEFWLHHQSFFGYRNIFILALFSFAFAFAFLATRFHRFRDALSAGFLGSLVASFLGLSGIPSTTSSTIYFTAAGLVLLVSTIESSFSMAYLDELTGLPGRRSLNDALVNLGRKYIIAMIDIDHFKKFNDRYGHKTGDQVLKMIATKLKDITGGAKVFRYGGEEFTAIFPGKTVEETLPHLEVYRKIIESTPFVLRGNERREKSAENKRNSDPKSQKQVKVTVSIGAAFPGKDFSTPEKVLKEADRMLYKAKKAGRNRVVRG